MVELFAQVILRRKEFSLKQRNRFFVIIIVIIVVSAFALIAEDLVKLPGVNTSDQHGKGCVDCHILSGNNDYRLNVSLKGVDGHPPIDTMVKTVPNDCKTCHKAGAYAGALAIVIHKSHYANPAENSFIANYQGQCLECHSLNPETGVMAVKSGAKNW